MLPLFHRAIYDHINLMVSRPNIHLSERIEMFFLIPLLLFFYPELFILFLPKLFILVLLAKVLLPRIMINDIGNLSRDISLKMLKHALNKLPKHPSPPLPLQQVDPNPAALLQPPVLLIKPCPVHLLIALQYDALIKSIPFKLLVDEQRRLLADGQGLGLVAQDYLFLVFGATSL